MHGRERLLHLAATRASAVPAAAHRLRPALLRAAGAVARIPLGLAAMPLPCSEPWPLPVQRVLHAAARGLRGCALAAIAALLAAALVVACLSWAGAVWIFPDYAYRHERGSGTGVWDARGRFLGLIPGHMDPLGDYAARFPTPDHKALYLAPEEVPEPWWRILVALEDRHLGTWRAAGGIDWLALVRALLWDWPRGRPSGASTLPMMLVRSMRHWRAAPQDPLPVKLKRKLVEWRDAPALAARLDASASGGTLRQWLAMHVPLAQGAPDSRLGDPLYGLATVSHTLYGVPPRDLSLAQQAMLAAAYFRPILLAPPNDPAGRRLAAARWERLRRRAAHGIRAAFGDDPRARRALRELASLPPPEPHVDRKLLPWLPADAARRFAVAANPLRRAHWLAGPELVQAIAELQDRYGRRWRRHVAAVRLSVDVARNAAFKRRVEQALRRLERRLSERLARPLAAGGPGQPAPVVVAVAGPDGRLLVRFYARGANSLYGGLQAHRTGDGRYDPRRETRMIGSMGKVPAAVYLAGAGDTPGQAYCNRALTFAGHRFQNSGGDTGVADCRQPRAYYRADQVFARSLNLPLLWRLRGAPETTLARLVDAFRLHRPDPSTPLRTALPLGMLTASPQTVHAMLHTVTAAVAGRSAPRSAPSLIASLTPTQDAQPADPEGKGSPEALAGLLADPAARAYLRRVLSAPLAPGGTAQSLGDWREGVHPRVQLHLAKTATVGRESTTDAWLGGGLLLDGHVYSYLAMAGTADPRHPLGRHIHGGDLTDLARAALRSLIDDPGGP